MLARFIVAAVVASVVVTRVAVAAADPPRFMIDAVARDATAYAIDDPSGAEVARGSCRSHCDVDPSWWVGPGEYVVRFGDEERRIAIALVGTESAIRASLAQDTLFGAPRVSIARVDPRVRAHRRSPGTLEITNGTDVALVARGWQARAAWAIGDLSGLLQGFARARGVPMCAFSEPLEWRVLAANATTELWRLDNSPHRPWPTENLDTGPFTPSPRARLEPRHYDGWIPLWSVEAPAPGVEIIYFARFGVDLVPRGSDALAVVLSIDE